MIFKIIFFISFSWFFIFGIIMVVIGMMLRKASTTRFYSIAELQTNNIISMKSVSLQSMYYHCALFNILKINKGKMNFVSILCISRNQSQSLKTFKRSKNMGYFSLSAIWGKSFHINSDWWIILLFLRNQSTHIFWFILFN